MSLEQLCHEIEHRAQRQSASLLKEAQEDARRVQAEARGVAEKTVQQAQSEAQAFASAESAERLANAGLEAQKILSDAREEAVRANLLRVWEKYSAQAKKGAYSRRLKAWAQEALDELGMGGILRTNAHDRSLLAQAGMRVSSEPLECAGGVRAETPDGRIGVDMTLEARFELKKEEVAQEIYARLFPQQGGAIDANPHAKKEKKKSPRTRPASGFGGRSARTGIRFARAGGSAKRRARFMGRKKRR